MGAFMPMVSHRNNLLESKDSCHCWSPGIVLQPKQKDQEHDEP